MLVGESFPIRLVRRGPIHFPCIALQVTGLGLAAGLTHPSLAPIPSGCSVLACDSSLSTC